MGKAARIKRLRGQPAQGPLDTYEAQMRHVNAVAAVHHDAFVRGECPQAVDDDDGLAVLQWLGAERLHREDTSR
ncbi:hypothetical protein LV457_02960 [Mycobacterium sp. MYCO198283]|uniref:hypothetical protein n=1 Tax=Mycobacterium sp. MYCO198283 TaxID=2883505 RepID=UPI001E473779|nr:hypothetical protein [Mycobacterium sp. MYCO198283]MCG5431250.1 hypothetical protein [Mycobacterium sp. MYCO198283]